MAAGTYQEIRPFSPEIYTRGTLPMKEKASQTFKKGALIILDSDGYALEASASPSTVWGIAAQDGQNGTASGDKVCPVWPLTDADLWEISFEDALAQTQIGDDYGLVKDSTSGFWYLDSGDSNDQVSVVAFKETPGLGNIGDTKARGYVKFNSGNIALN